MSAAKDAGADIVVDRNGIIGIVLTIDHELSGLGQQLVTIAREMAQLERLASWLDIWPQGLQSPARRTGRQRVNAGSRQLPLPGHLPDETVQQSHPSIQRKSGPSISYTVAPGVFGPNRAAEMRMRLALFQA